jgi:glycosyltransferase involved in cell wall biosynthesis
LETGIKNIIKILYDVTDILNGHFNNTCRNGIFFCSYNILKLLRNHTDTEISIYVNNEHKHLLSAIKKLEVLKGLKIISIRDTSIYKKKISFHLNTINNANSFILKFISLLKIIKNVLQIFFMNENRINMELKKINAIFSPHTSFPEIIYRYNIKRFRLLYDLTAILFPDYFSDETILFWKNNITKSLDKDTYFFCISECTKRDFLKYFGESLDKSKVTVTYISSANEFKPEYNVNAIKYIANKYKIKCDQFKYIFSFCSLEHRKNLLFTVKCFIKFIQKNNINNLYFLLGGEQWDNFIKYFNETISELPENYRSKIVRLGYVDDSDVNMLYSNSLFFTYLSQYEGFGMPLLEAMQSGTPVISSNNSSLPEVTGDAAISIDYDDEEACINAMEKFYFDEDLRLSYIKKGFERAKLFSWEKTVKIITDKIKEVENCC